MNDAQKRYKANIKRKFVEFDMRKPEDVEMYKRANMIKFSPYVKSLLK